MREVFANKKFLKMFLGNTTSYMGNGLYFIGLSWLVLQLSGSTASMGWLLAISSLPGIFLAPVMGVLIDRRDRRKICIAGDVFRGTVLLLIPLLHYLGKLEIWELYVVGFLLSLGDRFYSPAAGALVREIVPKEHLLRANSLSNMSAQIGGLVGSGIGGFLIVQLSSMANMEIDAASFFISAFFTLSIRNHTSVLPKTTVRKSVLKDYLNGLQYLKRHPYIIGLSALTVSIYVAFYTSNVIMPAFSMKVLKAGSVGFGLIDAAWAGGAIVAGVLLLSVLSDKLRDRTIIKMGLFALSMMILFFSISKNIPEAVAGYFMMGLLLICVRIKVDTMVQSEVENEFQGRVKSSIYMAIDVFSLAVYLGMGYIGDFVSLRIIYLAVGLIVFCAFLYSNFVFTFKGKAEHAGVGGDLSG